MKKRDLDVKVLNSIARRAHYLANQMIFMANNRDDVDKGDPKVGGHSSASASALHILGALHLVVKSGFDHVANKPHASPADHAYNYLLDLLLDEDKERISLEEANQAMANLRAFSANGEYVFQSYHSPWDPDHFNFFPSGTVGIPPVQAGYLAHAYRYAKNHGYEVPNAHFWAVIGDSEFREGSIYEAMPDFGEREIGNLTWIVDYNRQSLDGHRITNTEILDGTDADRIQKTMEANGWEVIQVRHGQLRLELFERPGGQNFKALLESWLSDYELQVLLQLDDGEELKLEIKKEYGDQLAEFLNQVSGDELWQALRDMGGHDIRVLAEAMEKSKEDSRRPTLIVAHTLKGWGLKMAALPANHSALPDEDEMMELRKQTGLGADQEFARFDENSVEDQFLKQRGEELYQDMMEQEKLRGKNQQHFLEAIDARGEIPESLDINLKMASYPHTQWMLGQLTAKLTRIANTPEDESKLADRQKPLSDFEKRWKIPAELVVSMAPDVGTSTNLNPSMDGKIFGHSVEDLETELGVKDRKSPDLIPGEEKSDRFLRFEIVEANTMSCMGSYGRLRDTLGIPILPLMTVYDFFIKRALDQFFYDLYWKSSFILVGTPSGVTLSPEGAQHGWKSDIQIPNQITWEPFYCIELDWILADAIRRHVMNDNQGRTGVLIRGVTRGAEQKSLLKRLKQQARFKKHSDQSLCPDEYPLDGAIPQSQVESLPEAEILGQLKSDVLAGAYFLVDYRGYKGYEPGDNVVHIFSMGSPTTEAIEASNRLLEKGIYANVIVVTSPDLLVGNLADENDYCRLKEMDINANLYLQPQLNGNPQASEILTMSGRRIPIVSVHDGEPGLLDNIGSVVGVKHIALAVRKHSKSGRPSDIYAYQNIDADSIIEACGKALAQTAVEQVKIGSMALQEAHTRSDQSPNWQELWDKRH